MPAPFPAFLKRWIFAQPMMTTRLLGYNWNGLPSAPLFRPNWRRAIPTGIVRKCARLWRSSWPPWHIAHGIRMSKHKHNIWPELFTKLWSRAHRRPVLPKSPTLLMSSGHGAHANSNSNSDSMTSTGRRTEHFCDKFYKHGNRGSPHLTPRWKRTAMYPCNVAKSSCWRSTRATPKSSRRDWSRPNKLTCVNVWTTCLHRHRHLVFSAACVATSGLPMSKCASRKPFHWSMTLKECPVRHRKQPSVLGSAFSKVWKVDNESPMKPCDNGGVTTLSSSGRLRFSWIVLPCLRSLTSSWQWDPRHVAKPKGQTIFQENSSTTSLWNWRLRSTQHYGSYCYTDRRTSPTKGANLCKRTRGVDQNTSVNPSVHFWSPAKSAKPSIERSEPSRLIYSRSSCRSTRSVARERCQWLMAFIKSVRISDMPNAMEIVQLWSLLILRKLFTESSDHSAWAAPSATRPLRPFSASWRCQILLYMSYGRFLMDLMLSIWPDFQSISREV